MTDYNDGEWHLWNGGDCHVHPKSVVDYVWHDPKNGTAGAGFAREAREDGSPTLAWAHVVKFRVSAQYLEPRTMWATGLHLHETREDAVAFVATLDAQHPGKGYAQIPITKMIEAAE